MTVNKGLLSLVENQPNFSNQALESAVATLELGWVAKSSTLDSLIVTNPILTASQKTDLKNDIDNIPHLNIGRVLGDLVRHTATIIDGTIVPLDSTINPTSTTFLEILQNVQSVQGLVPELYGVPASDKARSVNDHLGTLNNMFTTTEDSTEPVFTTMLKSIQFIVDADLATETALETAYTNLINFINSVDADSTDNQTTLDNLATALATAHTNLNNALASQPLLTHKNRLIEMRENINVQISLENSNIVGLDSFIDSLSSNISFASLAEDDELRSLMSKVAQDKNWQTYFENYVDEKDNLNPIYTTDTDSDKSSVIDQVLADSGLPDVTDATDFEAVARKARKDTRIDTAGYDRLTTIQQIVDACKQLLITTQNRTESSLSASLLTNMNQHDRDVIARQLDLNESADTLS
jgi:hypothetical protein|tara:strand:- start:753 stop:1985 length:1233 start_codon:yes stop_codon:yes gene_type:complete